jgi:hypothetical protein
MWLYFMVIRFVRVSSLPPRPMSVLLLMSDGSLVKGAGEPRRHIGGSQHYQRGLP